MAKSELDDFLSGEPEGEPAPAPAPEPEPKEPAAPPEPKAEPEPDDEPDQPANGTLAALQDERNKRRDWKEKAVRAETERDELRKQLDEAKRFAQQPPPQQYQEPPRERTDAEQRAYEELNTRLNFSEMSARDKHGDEVIEAAIGEFKKAAEINPSLVNVLHQQVHPYAWLVKEVEGLRLKREIGNDPAAFKARLRAEWEAERGATQEAPQQPQISPAARLAPSLANARSAAPRGAPAYTGPTDLDDILRR